MDEYKNLKIHEELLKIIDECGWFVEGTDECGNEFETELRQTSPAGEDFSFMVYHDNTNKGFTRAVRTAYQDFDKNEHVKMWANSTVDGVPNIAMLVEDAEAIKHMMCELKNEMEEKMEWLEALADKYAELAYKEYNAAVMEVTLNSEKHDFKAQFNIGRYHAFMKLLKEVDLDRYEEMNEEYAEEWNAITKGIKGIYKL